MRDVIIIGAGGGGPVVAKELAARGLDVLLLEAGPALRRPREGVDALRERRQQRRSTGFFRFGPADRSKPAWFRETPQNSLIWQLSGVGGTTQHYYGNNPRAAPGVVLGLRRRRQGAYDTEHLFPFTLPRADPVLRVGRAHAAGADGGDGHARRRSSSRGAEGLGPAAYQTSKDITRAVVPAAGERHPAAAAATPGKTTDPPKLVYPKATGCTFCGYCFQGCFQPQDAPRNLKAKRSTDNSYVPMALTADKWKPGGKAVTLVADAFVTRINTDDGGRRPSSPSGVHLARRRRPASAYTEEAKVIVMAGGCTEDPRLWLNSDLPNPNGWVGRGYTDHFFDWVIGRLADLHRHVARASARRRAPTSPASAASRTSACRPRSRPSRSTFSDAGIRGALRQRPRHDRARGTAPAGRLSATSCKELMSNLDHLLNVLVITDDDVEAQNRVTLSSVFPADEHGPIPKVDVPPAQALAAHAANREFLAKQGGRAAAGRRARRRSSASTGRR